MSDERFNAIRNGESFNCPVCHRARTLVQGRRDPSMWRCGNDRIEGCFTQFRLVVARDFELDTLVRVREPREVTPMSIEELAAVRGGRLA